MNRAQFHKPPVAQPDSGATPDNLRSVHKKKINLFLQAVNADFNRRYPNIHDGGLVNPDHIFGNFAQIQYLSGPTRMNSVEDAIGNIEEQKGVFDTEMEKVTTMLHQRYSKIKSAVPGEGSNLSPRDWLKKQLEKVDSEYDALMNVLRA